MGFQSGSQIDPRLGALDYSGYTNAAAIQGQAMANLGSQIGGAITQYKKKKEEKQLTEQAANMILSYAQKNPDAASELGVTDLETAKVAIKSLGGAAPTLQMLSQLQPTQEFKPSVENVAGQQFVETSKGKFAPMPQPDFKALQLQENRKILDQAIASNTDTGGVTNYKNVAKTAIELGHTDPKEVSSFVKDVVDTGKERAPLVSITGEDEYAKQNAQQDTKRWGDITSNASSARSSVNDLMQMKEALADIKKTGIGQGAAKTLKNVGQSLFNMDFEGLDDTEMFDAMSKQLALKARSTGEGAGMPGSMSDSDRQFLVDIVPNLSKSKEGNEKLIDYMIRVEKRSIEKQKKAAQYRKKNNGRLDWEFEVEWDDYVESNPLFKEESEKTKVRSRSPEEEAEYQELLRLQQG